MATTKAAGAAKAPAEPAAPKPDPRAHRIAEIIRDRLRNSPVSRDVNAWNFLQSQLPAIAEDILKEH